MDPVPTASQTVGPFFQIELTSDEHCVRSIAGRKTKGERAWMTFRVLDGVDCLPRLRIKERIDRHASELRRTLGFLTIRFFNPSRMREPESG